MLKAVDFSDAFVFTRAHTYVFFPTAGIYIHEEEKEESLVVADHIFVCHVLFKLDVTEAQFTLLASLCFLLHGESCRFFFHVWKISALVTSTISINSSEVSPCFSTFNSFRLCH